MSKLVLETRGQADTTGKIGPAVFTPDIHEDYWSYRVRLNDTGQAVIAFPKFFTMGIGFAQEEDWNTNLPYTCDTDKIFSHIVKNKGDDAISDDDVRAAIRLIQEAVRAEKAGR